MRALSRVSIAAVGIAVMLGSAVQLSAQGGGAPPAAGRGRGGGGAGAGGGGGGRSGVQAETATQIIPVPDTLFGLTEYDMARQKVESLIRPTDYAVMVINDMEGLGGVVNNGKEMSTGPNGRNVDHQRFRQELTDETNAAIAGARAAGANKFFVVEGHGANNWHSVLVEKLDPDAILMRGWPRPNAMETGVNSKLKAILVVGNHPNAGTRGIIAHAYAFGSPLTVNGIKLNESGISAFVGAEYGVPLAMVAGDDAYIAEMKELTHDKLETVVVKVALSGSGGAVMPLQRIHGQIKAAATRGVMRVKSGDIKPMVFTKPYDIRFCGRGVATSPVGKSMMEYNNWNELVLDPDTGPNCFKMSTSKSEHLVTLLNLLEWPSLKP